MTFWSIIFQNDLIRLDLYKSRLIRTESETPVTFIVIVIFVLSSPVTNLTFIYKDTNPNPAIHSTRTRSLQETELACILRQHRLQQHCVSGTDPAHSEGVPDHRAAQQPRQPTLQTLQLRLQLYR